MAVPEQVVQQVPRGLEETLAQKGEKVLLALKAIKVKQDNKAQPVQLVLLDIKALLAHLVPSVRQDLMDLPELLVQRARKAQQQPDLRVPQVRLVIKALPVLKVSMVSEQRVQQVLKEGQVQPGQRLQELYPRAQLGPLGLAHLATLVLQVQVVNQQRVMKFMRIP